MKIKINRLSVVLGGLLFTTSIHSSPEGLSPDRVRIGNFILPPFFSRALNEGLSVPVYLRYIDEPDHDNSSATVARQKVADVILFYDQTLSIKEISLIDQDQGTQLSDETRRLLQNLKNKAFQDHTRLHISEHAELLLDLKTLNLELIVDQQALALRSISRQQVLGPSTSHALTSVLNYRTGTYLNRYEGRIDASSYLNLDQIWAYREHHLSLNGAIYGMGGAQRDAQLYRAIYERDVDGYRFTAGLMDTWNLQSIVSMNALSVDQLYAVSYGNQSYTVQDDKTQSLTPIVVFLPSAGSVHIYRDGRLLSIQEMPMGSNEIDTTRLPFGIYTVQIKTMIDGQETAQTTAQINKTFGRNSSVMGKLAWQAFAGMLDYRQNLSFKDQQQFDPDQHDYRQWNRQNIDFQNTANHRRNRTRPVGSLRQDAEDEMGIDPSAPWMTTNIRVNKTWLAGVAGSISFPWLSGTTLKSTLYGFDQFYITESEANISVNSRFSLNQQWMWASDQSWRSSSSLNYQIPKALGNLWAIREYSAQGEALETNKYNNYGVGGSLNLKSLLAQLGYLSFSYNRDVASKSSNSSVDYNQNIFNSRHATVNLRTGIQYARQVGSLSQNMQDKYVYLEAKIPLSTRLSAGVTRQNKNTIGDLSFRKDFDQHAIRSVSMSVSNNLSQDGASEKSSLEDLRVLANTIYSSKYNQGSLSLSQNGSSNSSLTLNTQGSIAMANTGVMLGKDTQSSGVMIKTNLSDQSELSAQINGQSYKLSGKNNFIALAPFQKYSVELMNAKSSRDSVNVIHGRNTQVILYPGNVDVIVPEIKEMVTVFGRILDQDGQAAAHKQIHNHIGKTETDQEGAFVMDIDKRYPVINLIEPNGARCESKVNLKGARGAIWVGALRCKPLPTSTAPNLFEVRD